MQFNDSKGNMVEFTNPISSDDALVYGEEVKVRHIVDEPKQAKLDNWTSVWFATLITGIFFALFSTLGITLLIIKS